MDDEAMGSSGDIDRAAPTHTSYCRSLLVVPRSRSRAHNQSSCSAPRNPSFDSKRRDVLVREKEVSMDICLKVHT